MWIINFAQTEDASTYLCPWRSQKIKQLASKTLRNVSLHFILFGLVLLKRGAKRKWFVASGAAVPSRTNAAALNSTTCWQWKWKKKNLFHLKKFLCDLNIWGAWCAALLWCKGSSWQHLRHIIFSEYSRCRFHIFCMQLNSSHYCRWNCR